MLHVKHTWSGRLPPEMEQQGRGLWFKYPPRAGPCLARSHLWTEELKKNPGPVEQRSKRHSKQRKQARCREQRSPGVRGHCFCSRHPRQKVFILGERWLGRAQAPSPPHKLSLLEVVLAPSSVSRAQSRRSQFSGTLPSVPSIQGWAAIWSREGLSEGRRERHHSISCWHSGETLLRKKSLPRKISSSCSKGMSPHTMS